MKKIQTEFTKKILNTISLPISVNGFIKGKSYKNYLDIHCGSKCFLKVDIKDYFDSFTQDFFMEMFSEFVNCGDDKENTAVLDLIWRICTYNDKIPQGASSSPMLTNVLFRRIDQRITKYCQKLDISYSRYADDMIFSSDNFDFSKKKWFLRKVSYILRESGFNLNYSKTKSSSNYEININGFVVSYEEVRLSRKRLSGINSIIYTCKKTITQNKYSNDLEFITHYNLNADPKYSKEFINISELRNNLLGHRSNLLNWIPDDDSKGKDRILRTIENIETIINLLSNLKIATK